MDPQAYSDGNRRVAGEEDLEAIFKRPFYLAGRVLEQRHKQRGRKVYTLHAPKIECIDKGKAHAPYEQGNRVKEQTPNPMGVLDSHKVKF